MARAAFVLVLTVLVGAGCGGSQTGGKTGGAAAGERAGTAGAGGAAGAVTEAGRGGTTAAGGATVVGGGRGGGSDDTAGGAGAGGSPGGAGGTAGAGDSAGAGGAAGCQFTVMSSLSTAIPTVGVVTFTTSQTALASAQIRFGLASGGPTMIAPVDLTQPDHRTLLLGMKGSSRYVFRVVATSGALTCTSQDYTLMTGPVPSGPPVVTAAVTNASAHAKGFIVTSNELTPGVVFIFDSDGAVVWSAPFPGYPTRAHMSWDARDMYVVAENQANGTGNVARISMDGITVENNLSSLSAAHHDLTAIPDGIATLTWLGPGSDAHNALVERSTSGELTTVVADLASLYNSPSFHPNSIHYYPADDSYTIGDRNPHLFVKITRNGALVWQFGGNNPKDASKSFQGLPFWTVNHGHQLLADGTFLFFDNSGGSSIARGFKLDTSNMTATSVLSYQPTGAASLTLGDIQRLPNGNTLVTYSNGGTMHEIDQSGQRVATFQVPGRFGYAEFRESLYGPPPY